MPVSKHSLLTYDLRIVASDDLRYVVQWYGQLVNLATEARKVMLDSYHERFNDPVDSWRHSARVMTLAGRPIFLLEEMAGQAWLLAKPAIMNNPVWLRRAWQAALIHLLWYKGLAEVGICVDSCDELAIAVLESLGCERQWTLEGRSGIHIQYTSSKERLRIGL